MTIRPFVVHNVVQRFMKFVLTSNPAVVAEVGGNIYPNLAPRTLTSRHLSHDFGGPNSGKVAKAMRMPISQVGVFWDITAWEPGYSQQALDPVLEAVMAELAGADLTGTSRLYVDGDRTFGVDCDYFGPEIAKVESAPEGTWAPVCERYAVTVRPR